MVPLNLLQVINGDISLQYQVLMNVRGARKDRHARIGEGGIGAEALVRVINHPALRNLPFCLETPNELPGYAAEIRFLKDHRIG